MTLANNYLFKAIDAFPYELEETIEALNYALSYDEKNTEALCLLGRIYAEVLKDYELAKQHYSDALTINVKALNVYPHYINVLLWNEDFEEAERLIDFALSVKGSDKASLHLNKAVLFEMKKEYKKALAEIKQAKIHNYNNEFSHSIKENKERIKGKLPNKKKDTKKKNKKKN